MADFKDKAALLVKSWSDAGYLPHTVQVVRSELAAALEDAYQAGVTKGQLRVEGESGDQMKDT